MALDAARIATEVTEQLLIEEFDQFDALANAAKKDPGLMSNQVKNVDALMEMFSEDQDKYLQLLLDGNKDIEYKAEKLKRVKFIKRRNAMNMKLAQPNVAAPGATTGTQPAYRVQLPQRNIPSFGGNVREWKSFWAAFQVVDGDISIPTIEKLNYLRQYTVPGSKANKIVVDLPPAETSYELAVKEMTRQFGREKTIIKTYVRDLLHLVLDNLEGKRGKNLVDVVSALQSHIWNLEQLGVTSDKFGTLLYPIVECCIPREVLTRYLESDGAKEELQDFMEFLRKAVSIKEETRRAQEAFLDREEKRHNKRQSEENCTPTAATFLNTENSCGFCGMRNHKTEVCRNSDRMTYEERKAALQKANCCFKCFQRDHHSRNCNSNVTCNSCKGKHHTMMCSGGQQATRSRIGNVNISEDTANNNPQADHHMVPVQMQQQMNPFIPNYNWNPQQMYMYQPPPPPPPVNQNVPQQRTDMANYIQKPEVLLQTLYAKLHLDNGYKIVRISMDSMSQSSYILKKTIEGCNLEHFGMEKVVHQTFGGKLSEEVQHEVKRIALSGMGSYSHVFTFSVSVVETIAEKVIGTPDGPWYKECAQLGIPINDTKEPADIEVLIGNDYAPYFKVGMRSILLSSGIIATETKLGWYLEGRIPGKEKRDPTASVVCINMALSNLNVNDYWSLDTIGIKDPYDEKTRKELNEATLEHFHSTVRRDETGRYIVHLPGIEGRADIPDNRNIAFRVFETFTKFTSRRGRPSVVYSDNGTNLVGSRNFLLNVDWEEVQRQVAVLKITWILNAPTAAWWGGFCERLIGMMKQIMRRVLGKQRVSKHQLELLVVEVEYVMNERALTYVTEDSDDLQPLKPSLFMRDLPVSHMPELEVSAGMLRKSFAHLQKLKLELRSRLRKEYLSQLICQGKSKSTTILMPGDIVMMEVDNKTCIEWPLGVVVEVYPSRDGQCRTARVRTNGGELVRPFQRLFLPEMERVPEKTPFLPETGNDQPEIDDDQDMELQEVPKEANEKDKPATASVEPVATPRRSMRKRTRTKRLIEEIKF